MCIRDRNAGLDAARGLYVGFADPDDYMDPEMYSRLFSAALEYDADIVECGNPVSYTHLDVYKRQAVSFSCPFPSKYSGFSAFSC